MASCLQATPNADDTVAAFFGEGVTYFHAVADAYPLVHAQDVPAAALEDEAAGEGPQQELGKDETADSKGSHVASRNNSRSPGTGASTDLHNQRSSQNHGHEAT